MENEKTYSYPNDSVRFNNIVSMEKSPLEGKWSEFVINPHFNETGIAMLLKLDQNHWESLRKTKEKLSYPANTIPAMAIRDWFPEHLKNQFTLNDDGNSYSVPHEAYAANQFMKKPFFHGFAFFYGEYLFIYVYNQ